jgi:hypothetical protein
MAYQIFIYLLDRRLKAKKYYDKIYTIAGIAKW